MGNSSGKKAGSAPRKSLGKGRLSWKRLSKRDPKLAAEKAPETAQWPGLGGNSATSKRTPPPVKPRPGQRERPQESPPGSPNGRMEAYNPKSALNGGLANPELQRLKAKLDRFYAQNDPESVSNGTVVVADIAAWALAEPNGLDLLEDELCSRFGRGLRDSGDAGSYNSGTMESDSSGAGSSVQKSAQQSFGTPRSSFDSFFDDSMPPPPPPDEDDFEGSAFGGDYGQDEFDDDGGPSPREIKEMRDQLEKFFLLYAPSSLMSEMETFIGEFRANGQIALNVALFNRFGKNLSSMANEEVIRTMGRGSEKPSVHERFGVAIHSSEVLSEFQSNGRRLTETMARPSRVVRKESMVSSSLERKWRERKESNATAVSSKKPRSSLEQAFSHRESNLVGDVCTSFELDMTGSFGACRHCGKNKTEHKPSNGVTLSATLARKWKNKPKY